MRICTDSDSDYILLLDTCSVYLASTAYVIRVFESPAYSSITLNRSSSAIGRVPTHEY